MIEGLRTWILGVTAAAIIAALSDSLMPAGSVKRVGKLLCGLVLLAAMLNPVKGFSLSAGRAWLEEYTLSLALQTENLEQEQEEQMKIIIEEQCCAYIVDKATELRTQCIPYVTCEMGADGVFTPTAVTIIGDMDWEIQSLLSALIAAELGIPPENQIFYSGEGSS